MSTSSPPTIPPRPTRAQQAAAAGASKLPEIPPRPTTKKTVSNRSISPANYPQSPLFEMPSSTMGRTISNDPSNLSLPPRPPSVTLPSIGQEGSEYADIQYENSVPNPPQSIEAAAQTRNVGGDLQLHAPKPSLPTASAKTQVEAVTKTTAKQVAALGLGKPSTPGHDDQEHAPVPLRAKSSFSRPASSASNERRASVQYGEDQVTSELGIRVPINPLLGEVQAPSPAPFGDKPLSTGGNGGHGQRKRHIRTMSGREVFLPPGSYGLHAHGVQTQDKFEQDWYAKHPEQYVHDEDQGHYASTGTGRGEFALSSEDLNQIVRSTASRGAGFGTSGLSAYPDEQIGYLASEQYASRSSVVSPNPLSKLHSNVSQPAIESPLRKTSFPADDVGQAEFNKSKESTSGRSDEVVESELDDEVIHIDDPRYHSNKVTGGEETIREKEDVQPYITHPTEENDFVNEHGYSVPILAEDEVAREVGQEDMQPAVPPNPDRRGSAYDLDFRGSGDVTPSSRPVSRPSSIHGGIHGMAASLSRFTSRHEDYREDMYTPLEDVDEYEPLFPDEDSKKKAMSTKERFNRPDTLKHRFPSQDIWEDTPSSAMHVAMVSTPDIPGQVERPAPASSSRTFEPPEAEAARKSEPTEPEKRKLLPNEERLAKSNFAPHLRDDMSRRPGLQPRFPSQDIWEDTPDSHYLVTTVSSTQDDEVKSPPEASISKPSIPPRPVKHRLAEGASSVQVPPGIPPRPEKTVYAVPPADAQVSGISTSSTSKGEKESFPTELRKVPSIPDRPKPQIPARPAKKTSGDSLSKTVSATSAGSSGSTETERGVSIGSPPQVKAKPSIPPRPGQGSKIANLKGNFMNDLNQKLQLGPSKEKEPEPEAEKEVKPLEDARKGRPRGPQRRAPAKSPSAAGESATGSAAKQVRFSLSSPTTMWQINPAGSLRVHGYEESETAKEAAANDAPIAMAYDKVAQMEHSKPGGAPLDSVAEGTTDDGTAESKAAQTSSTRKADVPDGMAPAGLAANTAGEPVDPVPGTDQAIPHTELSPRTSKLKEQDCGNASLSQQTTASSGAASGHALGRVRAEDHEQGSSLSKHTTASSMASGVTLDRQTTVEDPNRKVVGGAAEEPKEAMQAPATEAEEKLAGADRPREPRGEEDVDYGKLEEMTAKADGKGHAGVEPDMED